uniref:Uncharacterized protein n=1 Tax=Octopus bimaculoides TaxID=37653 RepID=A0A0L8H260_OCTBM
MVPSQKKSIIIIIIIIIIMSAMVWRQILGKSNLQSGFQSHHWNSFIYFIKAP